MRSPGCRTRRSTRSSCARPTGRAASGRSTDHHDARGLLALPYRSIQENTMAFKTLDLSIANAVATVTLNRPDKRNAMNPTLHIEMTELLEQLRYDDSVKVI